MHFAASHDGFWLLSPFYRFIVFRFSPLSSFSLFPALSFFALSFSLYIFVLFIYRSSRPRPPWRFFGGGGSCRRQGKSAAPEGLAAWWMWLVS